MGCEVGDFRRKKNICCNGPTQQSVIRKYTIVHIDFNIVIVLFTWKVLTVQLRLKQNVFKVAAFGLIV